MNFKYEEKLAILRILEKVAKADNKIMEEEMQVLLNAAKYLNADVKMIRRSKDMSFARAGRILRGMNHDKKELINAAVLDLMAADGVIDRVEVQTLLELYLDEDPEEQK